MVKNSSDVDNGDDMIIDAQDMLNEVATMEHVPSGKLIHLGATHVVGRASSCHLRLSTAKVSSVHAELLWDGASWQIRDLGSRNGTFVDERRLSAGEEASLVAGSLVTFAASDHCYRMVDVSPPTLMAAPEHGEPVLSEDGLLCLPSPETSEVSIFEDARNRWVLESDKGTRPIEDQSLVVAGGTIWRITLPAVVDRTREAVDQVELGHDEVSLEFHVSRDSEHVSTVLRGPATARELKSRAHSFLLLLLAQSRLDDAAREHLPVSEHGWVHRDDLQRMLNADPPVLNLWVFRARQQLAQAGMCRAGSIIERREGSGQLRIGVKDLQIAYS